jgi:hypothetical protein
MRAEPQMAMRVTSRIAARPVPDDGGTHPARIPCAAPTACTGARWVLGAALLASVAGCFRGGFETWDSADRARADGGGGDGAALDRLALADAVAGGDTDRPAEDAAAAMDSAPPTDAAEPEDATTAEDAGPSLDWRAPGSAQGALLLQVLAQAAAQGSAGSPSARLVGPDFGAGSKWNGAVVAPSGTLFFIPAGHPRVLEVDPRQDPIATRELGPDLGTAGTKHVGGVLAPDGKIYGAPTSSSALLIIDPGVEPPAVTTQTLGAISGAWVGGSVGFDGKLYFCPRFDADVLRVDLSTGTPRIDTIGDVASLVTLSVGDLFSAGVLSPHNGRIYCAPFAFTRVLEIDPATASVQLVGPAVGGSGVRWYGAALAADGMIYAVPDGAPGVLRIDSAHEPVEVTVIAGLGGSYDGAALAASGAVFAMPWNSSTIGVYAPATQGHATLAAPAQAAAAGLWAGGTLGLDGKIYGVPDHATHILEIDPHAVATLPAGAVLGTWLNGY